jgi:hypothetical protein
VSAPPDLHPRELVVTDAKNDLLQALDAVVKKHGLTPGETMRVVNTVHGDWVRDFASILIRLERHGDPNKPGGQL